MTAESSKRLVREGDLVAEVDVHLVEGEGGWAPYLSLRVLRPRIQAMKIRYFNQDHR